MPVADEVKRRKAVELYQQGLTGPNVAEALGVSVWVVYSALRVSGITRRGPRNDTYPPGTKHTTKEGYVVVKVPETWQFFTSLRGYGDGSWKAEHRKTMCDILGRALLPGEQVHHKNGDRSDNSPGNLQLRLGPHGAGAAFRCGQCGSNNVIATPLADNYRA